MDQIFENNVLCIDWRVEMGIHLKQKTTSMGKISNFSQNKTTKINLQELAFMLALKGSKTGSLGTLHMDQLSIDSNYDVKIYKEIFLRSSIFFQIKQLTLLHSKRELAICKSHHAYKLEQVTYIQLRNLIGMMSKSASDEEIDNCTKLRAESRDATLTLSPIGRQMIIKSGRGILRFSHKCSHYLVVPNTFLKLLNQ
ncbi:hypothetical protein EGR_03744 [Echinococcus granulosus]|uniref:Uncharacterized protein n=1 Tax=Echinococcus granulosus TaxID=6210 RepID=W6V5C3_ECHGR|nr:hypothetical protein EGR_03744 [Echinococcus granulosus]EUB61454.1 hypothetical protein EGR_03744 [Echinococcus granulosus]